MSILIEGMEMPKGRPVCIVIDAAGQARRYDLNNDRYADDKLFEAVHVPPHGKLIDADALYTELAKRKSYGELSAKSALRVVANAPTIIPKSGGTEDE